MSAPERADFALLNDVIEYANGNSKSELQTARLAREVEQFVRHTRNGVSLSALAITQGLKGKFEDALNTYDQAIAAEPSDPEIASNHAVLLRLAGDPNKALGEALRAWDLEAGEASHAREAFVSACSAGDFAEAQNWLERLEKMKKAPANVIGTMVREANALLNSNGLDSKPVMALTKAATDVMHEHGVFAPIEPSIGSDEDSTWISFRVNVSASPAQCVELENALIEKLLDLHPENDPGAAATLTFRPQA